jgi:hypothetical protein
MLPPRMRCDLPLTANARQNSESTLVDPNGEAFDVGKIIDVTHEKEGFAKVAPSWECIIDGSYEFSLDMPGTSINW